MAAFGARRSRSAATSAMGCTAPTSLLTCMSVIRWTSSPSKPSSAGRSTTPRRSHWYRHNLVPHVFGFLRAVQHRRMLHGQHQHPPRLMLRAQMPQNGDIVRLRATRSEHHALVRRACRFQADFARVLDGFLRIHGRAVQRRRVVPAVFPVRPSSRQSPRRRASSSRCYPDRWFSRSILLIRAKGQIMADVIHHGFCSAQTQSGTSCRPWRRRNSTVPRRD